ncbi:MAG: hypothetical protein HQ522_05730 [Bacteroidetes bacterium]|nr:hypothetical protein [Bacteroidota bacterium]
MQIPPPPTKEEKNILLDQESIKQILETRNWTMFLSILSFVFIGLGLIFLLITLVTAGGMLPAGARWTIMPGIVLLILYFIPFYFLFKFSVISKEALSIKGIYKLSDALVYLKKHYRFLGIISIALIALYLIIILIMIFTAGHTGF